MRAYMYSVEQHLPSPTSQTSSGGLLFEMGSPIHIEPGNLVSQGYANFRKTVWMTIVHLKVQDQAWKVI